MTSITGPAKSLASPSTVEKSKRIAAQLVEEAAEALMPFAERARNLQAIAQYLYRRTS